MKQLQDEDFDPNLKLVRPYASQPGSWGTDAAVLVLIVALMGFCTGLTDPGRRVLESARQMFATRSRAPQDQQEPKGMVLMIGLTEENERNITLTITPRGYLPIVIPSADGLPERIEAGLVQLAIVDRRNRSAGRALDAIRHMAPAAHVIQVDGPVPSTKLAQMLLEAL